MIAVEIKIKPDIEDINGRVERREKRYRYAYLHDDKRDYLGGIAGVVFSESDKEIRAQKGGLSDCASKTFGITVPEGSPAGDNRSSHN